MLTGFPLSDDPGSVETNGMIVQIMAGPLFKVKLSNMCIVLAHLKLRKRFIKLVTGDRVRMEMSPGSTTKARIICRL